MHNAKPASSTYTVDQGIPSPRPPKPLNTTRAGAEPGINPRLQTAAECYGHFKQDCVIEVADYCCDKISLRRVGNSEFVKMMDDPLPLHRDSSTSVAGDALPTWVRWINIGGLDWDVISTVGLKYNLHALALEDVLHEQGHNQSKTDYYQEHLYMHVLCHTLEPEDQADTNGLLTRAHSDNAEVGATWSVPEKTGDHSSDLRRRTSGLSGFLAPARKRRILKIKALTRGDRINVRHEPLSIFLLRNGTVITINRRPSLDFTSPIAERLLHPESVLRTSEDASLLVESLLDLVVDRILEIMDKYQDKIYDVEHDVLLEPGLRTMRSLHILSGDLIMHRRTLDPIKTLIHGLRHQDLARSIALANHTDAEAEQLANLSHDNHGTSDTPNRQPKIRGFLSYKATLYLSDVSDHMDLVLTSLDMFAGLAENLINFAFNTASYEMNNVMRRLTLTTIIFLPLTLLTGYFGMNFTQFADINGSVSLFWKISLPMMAALIPLFMLADIRRIFQYAKKRLVTRQSIKAHTNSISTGAAYRRAAPP